MLCSLLPASFRLKPQSYGNPAFFLLYPQDPPPLIPPLTQFPSPLKLIGVDAFPFSRSSSITSKDLDPQHFASFLQSLKGSSTATGVEESGVRELYNPHAHDLSARATSGLKAWAGYHQTSCPIDLFRAACIKKIFEVDPLQCQGCGETTGSAMESL